MISHSESTDELGCPKCDSPLVQREAPFYLHGEFVGVFESLVCEMCHFSALTSQGYQKAIVEAEKFGLVGPAEEISVKGKVIGESVTPIDDQFVVPNVAMSTSTIQALARSGEDIKAESRTTNAQIIRPGYYIKYRRLSHAKYEMPRIKN